MTEPAGAVIASIDGYFAWWESHLASCYDGDDVTTILRPHFTHEPDSTRIYSSRRAAERAMKKIARRTFVEVAVVELVELG